MEKRYQVFVSSTYVDLKEERQKVIRTIMEADCIPSGMELFPAADEEQFNFIKKIIDDCDYYLLIIGGRYGSTTDEGVSFTEKEYDYAIGRGLKVIAFLHSNPDTLGAGKSETDAIPKQKLAAFRNRVSKGRLVKFWERPDDLPGLVALSLQRTIKTFPAVGWIRANYATSLETFAELNSVRKENSELKIELANIRKSILPDLTDLASLDEQIEIVIHTVLPISRRHLGFDYSNYPQWSGKLSWRELFYLLSPHLLDHPNDGKFNNLLAKSIAKHFDKPEGKIDDEIYQTIKIHLSALKLVTTSYSKTVQGGMALFWELLPAGKALMTELRSVKTKKH